tara:strand:+ start:907 stop:2322 length:1416 start_codon:yes stop_codon:yes gene_type:complete
MDETSPVFQNFQNKMSAMSGRPKMNVTNMKTIFGDGKRGAAAISGKSSTLVRGGGLDNNKLFQLEGSGDLEQRVSGNERKITLLKNILKAQKPFGGKEDDIIKINSTLQSIGNILTTDFASRVNEGKLENKLLKSQLDAQRKNLAEQKLEKSKKITKKGSIIGSVASKVTSPLTGILDKLLSASLILGAGIAGNAAVKWWTNLTQAQQDRVVNGLKIAAVSAGVFAGFGLGKKIIGGGLTLFGLGRLGLSLPKILKRGLPRAFIRSKIAKDLIFNNKSKFNKTPLGGKKNFFSRFFKNKKVIQSTSKEGFEQLSLDLGKEASKSIAKKTGAKITAKRIAAGSLPIIGALVDGYAGIESLLKGDTLTADLFFASAASSFIPGKGSAVSIPLTAAAITSAYQFDNRKLIAEEFEEDTKVIFQDLNEKLVEAGVKKDNLSNADATEVIYVPSTNISNVNMTLTPKIHGIMLEDE